MTDYLCHLRILLMVPIVLLLTWPTGLYGLYEAVPEAQVEPASAVALGSEAAATEAKTIGAFAGDLGAIPCLPLPEQPLGILVKRETAARCVRADVGHEYGESAPSTITVVQHGPKQDHSYISSRSPTKRHVQPGVPWRRVLLYAYVISAAILGLYVLFALSPRGRTFFADHFWRSVWWHRLAGWEVFATMAVVTLLLAYHAGSVFVIDNATESDVQVRVNGASVGSLPRGHFVETRVGGGDAQVEVLVDARVVESATLRLDQSLRERVSRMLVGRGWCLYNIAGANAYVLERPLYAPRGY